MPNYNEAVERLTDSTDIEPRDARALTEYLTVLPEYGRAKDANGLYMVVSQSGSEYLVDTRLGACECPDHEHRGVTCKHQRRVEYVTGERAIPAWVDPSAIDEHLGVHVDSTPVLAATDGGTTVDESEMSTNAETVRPDDCGCWDPDQGLPCWPCFREGFETPNAEKREE